MTSSDEVRLDPVVISALYTDHSQEIRRMLLGLLRDRSLVNDALQRAFVKALECEHVVARKSLKSWFFRVAYNEALAMRRRSAMGDKIARNLAWLKSNTLKNDAGQSPDSDLLRWETVQTVQAALSELPPEQRMVVCKRIFENMTFSEISQELGIPLGTALSRMRAALSKLRKALGSDEL